MGIAVTRAAGLGHARTFTGWKGAWRWIERRGFRLVHLEPWVTLTILFTALCAALWLPLAVWLWFDGHRISPFVLLLVVVLQLRPWYGNRPRCLAAPVAIYAVLPLLLHGLTSAFFRKEIVWKGRRVKAA